MTKEDGYGPLMRALAHERQAQEEEANRLRDTGNFALGVTSVWIVTPALLALLTPPTQVGELSAGPAWLRRAMIPELTLASMASLLSWYDWSPVRMCLDQTLASLGLIGALALAMLQGGWVAGACASLLFLSAGTFAWAMYTPEGPLRKYLHLLLRLFAFWALCTGLNCGAVAFHGPGPYVAELAACTALYLVNVSVEWHYAAQSYREGGLKRIFSGRRFFQGMVRTFLLSLCFIAVCAWLDR